MHSRGAASFAHEASVHGSGDETDFPYGVYRLFTIDDTVDSIEVMVERYFNLPNIAVSLVQVPSFNGTARLYPGLPPSQFTAVRYAARRQRRGVSLPPTHRLRDVLAALRRAWVCSNLASPSLRQRKRLRSRSSPRHGCSRMLVRWRGAHVLRRCDCV